MRTLTLGDFTSTGLDWTRPVRISGLQIRRDFSSDTSFATDPSLSYSGVAVLPSAVDVYIDAVHAWSGQVPAGPFTLSDVPTVTPQGEAVFVLHAPSGAEHISRVSFFSTQNLLRAGVWDYALQAGFARQDYGQASFDYGKTKIGIGSARFGMTDRLTLSAQIEATTGLTMAGGGVDTVLFNRAEVSLSAAQSRSDAGRGHLVAFALHKIELTSSWPACLC
jgi:outer membrane usher protein